jgi:glycosyltransferase involved in cell wall biosynthesis
MDSWLLISGDFTPLGGMDYANHALAKYLAARQGAEVHLVTHRAWPDLMSMPQITVHRVRRPLRSHLAGMPLLARAGRRWAARLWQKRQARVVVNGGNCRWHDISWVHYVHAAYRPQVAGSLLFRLRTRLTHSYALAAERATVRNARLVLCNSRRSFRDVTERLGVPESRCRVVYYGTDPRRFHPIAQAERAAARTMLGWKNDWPIAVFVGALGDRRKGFDTLFAAWQVLCRNPNWDCNLAVIGAGLELPAWQQRARQVGIADRIHFLGFRQDVPQVLAACDVMVHPARYEAYGLGVHEALCRGLPAIVSTPAGVAERYPAELQELLLPDAYDPAGLADRLQSWRNNLERFRSAVVPFSEILRGHDWDMMAGQIVRLIEQAA